MSAQVSPVQRCQRRGGAIGVVAVQLPAADTSSPPSTVSPDSEGAIVLATGAAATAVVGADSAEGVPAGFVAVTTTRIILPTSSEVSRYVVAVAPAMSVHAPPVQRCHRRVNDGA